ncbi:MAG: hypothetical protein IT360_02855 [Gemmatimonadaceae bacterium]|nr:hypothetical protein [Gemmatimonadaceae bacterium]
MSSSGSRPVGAVRCNGAARETRASRRWACATLALAVLSTGCFTYVPAVPEALREGMNAQIQLSLDGSRDVLGVLGTDVRLVRGIVQSSSADSVVLRVMDVQLFDGQVTSSNGTVVSFGRQQMAEMKRRVHSAGRTAAAVGLAIGAIVVVYVSAGSGSGGGIEPPPPPPPTSIIPR